VTINITNTGGAHITDARHCAAPRLTLPGTKCEQATRHTHGTRLHQYMCSHARCDIHAAAAATPHTAWRIQFRPCVCRTPQGHAETAGPLLPPLSIRTASAHEQRGDREPNSKVPLPVTPPVGCVPNDGRWHRTHPWLTSSTRWGVRTRAASGPLASWLTRPACQATKP
jgi:hypothetical protein